LAVTEADFGPPFVVQWNLFIYRRCFVTVMDRKPPNPTMESSRKAYLVLAAKIAKELDDRKISEEEIERDFIEWQKLRRQRLRTQSD
jgi:hypothetical protein